MAKKIDLKKLAIDYAEIERQLAILKLQKEGVQAEIKDGMKQAGANKVETNQGTFTIYPKTTWEYSENHKIMENAIKAQEEKEKKDGIAKAITTEAFRFTPVKVKSA